MPHHGQDELIENNTIMSWKCPQCAVDGLDDSFGSHAIEAGGCGYVRLPAGIALKSIASGQELEIRVAGSFGRRTLERLADPEINYVSSEQFSLDKRPADGGWAVVGVSWATNPTYLNGAEIPEGGSLLKEGDELSIKGKYFRLSIRLLM